jgi:hypothetical protein
MDPGTPERRDKVHHRAEQRDFLLVNMSPVALIGDDDDSGAPLEVYI